MNRKLFNVTRGRLRAPKRADAASRQRGRAITRNRRLRDMIEDLRERAQRFDQTRRGAKTLLERLAVAEVEGASEISLRKLRRKIGRRFSKRLGAEMAIQTEKSLRTTPFTLTPEEVSDLKRAIDQMAGREWIPHEVVRQEMLDDMASELQDLARTYLRTGHGARHFLEYLAMAEAEGADEQILAGIRCELGQRVMKRQTA